MDDAPSINVPAPLLLFIVVPPVHRWRLRRARSISASDVFPVR